MRAVAAEHRRDALVEPPFDAREQALAQHASRAVLVLLELVAERPHPDVAAAEIGTRIDGFELPDVYGRSRSLTEWADKPLVVVAFLGTECPLSRQYAPRLQELSASYAERGAAFIGIDANPQDSLTDISNLAKQFGIRAFERITLPDVEVRVRAFQDLTHVRLAEALQ